MTLTEAIEKGIDVACKVENVAYVTITYENISLRKDAPIRRAILKFFVNEEFLSINTLMRRDHLIYHLWYVKLPREIQDVLGFDSYKSPYITAYSEDTITLPISRINALLDIDA